MSIRIKSCQHQTKLPNPFARQSGNCQFSFESSFITRFAGKYYCPLHLPADVKRGWDENQCRELLNFCRNYSREIHNKEERVINFDGIVIPSWFKDKNFHASDKQIIFSNCEFMDHFSYGDRLADNRVYFSNTKFHGLAELCGAKRVHMMGGCDFSDRVRFDGADLSIARFSGSAFSKHARFDQCRFNGPAEFSGSNFSTTCTFEGAQFRSGLWFLSGRNEGISSPNSLIANNFQNCEFHQHADFSARMFLGSTDFGHAKFFCVPKFYNSTLHEDTTFAAAEFLNEHTSGASGAYRVLKQKMESIRAWDEAGRFFKLEQEAKIADGQFGQLDKVISYGYGLISDYGNSIFRPFVSYLAANIFFLILYNLILVIDAFNKSKVPTKTEFYNLFNFWMSQILFPFSSTRYKLSIFTADGENTIWEMSLGGTQSIIGLVILTLFILAVRRRFKLD